MTPIAQKSQAVSEGTTNVTGLKLLQVTESLIVIEYDLLPDTNPGKNGNMAYIWQNKQQIPYTQTPENKTSITGSTQRGTFSFPVDLRQNQYIVGYAVGPELSDASQKYGNICSTVFIPGVPPEKLSEGVVVPAEEDEFFFSNLTLGVVSGDVVTFKYAVPANCQPKKNKAWIGVFRGSASYSDPPEKSVPVESNEDSGWMAVNHKFVANKKYTLVYFMSGYNDDSPVQTRMAATLSFTA